MNVSSAVWLAGSERIGVAAERHRHLELAVGNIDVGAHGDIGLLAGAGLDLFGTPDHRADILLALGIGGILVIQHDALRHRRELLGRRGLADAIGNFRLRKRRGILWRFHHRRLWLEQAGDGGHHRLAPQDPGAHQDQHDADRDRALERKYRSGAGAPLRLAVRRKPRARRRRLGVALRFLDRLVIGIGRVGIGAAVFHARLEPVELRRGRGHVGIGLSRSAVGLGRGAAEIVGVGGDVAESAHARGLLGAVVGAAARRARALAGRRQLRVGHRDLRLGIGRLRPRWRRRIGAKVARRALVLPIFLSGRPLVARLRRRRARARALRCRWRRRFARPRIGPGAGAERVAGARAIAAGARCVADALGGLGFDLAHRLFQRQPLAGDFGLAQRRLHAAQLRDQRGARPFIKRAAALAGGTGIQSGNSAGDQRVVISHLYSTLRAFRNIPLSLERVLDQNSILAFRAGGKQGDWAAHQFFHPADIFDGLRRQIRP